MPKAPLVLLLLIGGCISGCGDDKPGPDGGTGDDLGGGGDGGSADLAGEVRDMTCVPHAFLGFAGDNSVFHEQDCSCGCVVDAFENNLTNAMWGRSVSNGAVFTPMQGVGLGVELTFTTPGTLESGGLASEGPTAQFYLDGDFDITVEYDLGSTPPPGTSHLVLGTRTPGTSGGTFHYEVERYHHDDGSDSYETNLGGIAKSGGSTTATHGTLRLTRSAFVVTSYADGQQLSTLIAQNGDRLLVTLAATLSTCSGGATPCSYTPRWHLLKLVSGHLVNQR
jgi:hypothetical protein